MKFFLKVIGFLLLGLVLLLVALAVAVRFYFTPQRVKGIIETQVAEKLHRQVKLGEISVGLFSGLTITDFSLSEAPDFSKGTFISSQRFRLVPQLLPLLQKKVFIDELVLVKPNVNVIRNLDGKTFNFSSLSSSTASAAPAGASASSHPSPMAFLVSKVIFESGRLSFVDQSPAAQSIEINQLNLSVRNVSLVAPVEAHTDFTVNTKGIEAAIDFSGSVWALKGSAKIKQLTLKSGASSLSASGEVTEALGKNPLFDLKILIDKLEPSLLASLGALPSSVRLKDPLSGNLSAKGSMESVETAFKLNLGALSLSGDGTVKNPTDPKRFLTMEFTTNDCPIAALLALAPADSLPKDVKLAGNTQLSLKVKGTLDTGTLDLVMEGKTLDVAYSTDFKKQAGVPMSVGIQGIYSLPLSLDMRSISLILSQLQMTGSGTYKSVKEKSVYALNLKTNAFPLEDLSPMVAAMKDYGMAGKASTNMKVTSLPSGPDVKGKAQLSGVSLLAKGVKISGIDSAIDYSLKDASGKLTASSLQHEYFSGSNMVLNWNLTDVSDMAKLAGTSNLKIGKGEFQNIQKLTADSKVARILFMPITLLQKYDKVASAIKLPNFNKVAYKEILGDYTFKSGSMNVKSFNLDANDLTADMKGTIGLLGAQPLNLDSVIKVAAGLLGGTVGDILSDEKGRATIKMKITGTVDDPQVKVDMADAGKKALDVIKEKYGDDLKQGVDNLLKGLFKK